ncbi:uncharacterized protein LOC34622010 [Cyclospora cayetanensis]|uniref:Uncharacterized protein LOC34622010 n=1 Tax=Cyclospora cayetanensis TaxID=88456 RepID=A0A6P6RRU0_9EIME|nr:uncharacterized protein LOC34622010 [Cyclospora cayetanensis]
MAPALYSNTFADGTHSNVFSSKGTDSDGCNEYSSKSDSTSEKPMTTSKLESSKSSKSSKKAPQALVVAESAEHKLKEMMGVTGTSTSEDLVLRLAVKPGGCSGLSYSLQTIEKVISYGCALFSALVLNHPHSFFYVFGTVLSYSNDLMGGGFKLGNPNASKTCGCGMSFGVPKNFIAATPIRQQPSKGPLETTALRGCPPGQEGRGGKGARMPLANVAGISESSAEATPATV